MLYERWCQIARQNRREIALVDSPTGRRWTFQALATAAEAGGSPASGIAFPQGISTEFVLTVLRAWRTGAVVCPLEPRQEIGVHYELPPECVHLKTTSASTGVPRLIAFTSDQLLADVEQIVATMGLRPDWPNLG